MNATEDGVKPMGEAPEVTGPQHADVNAFGQQAITLKFDGGHRTVVVPAQPTECPHLVITPTAAIEDGRVQLRGSVALTHTHTGHLLVASTYVTGLLQLAAALKDFDWDFSGRDHFTKPENADKAAGIRAAIRAWQTDQGYNRPVSLWGDDAEKKAARNAAPAQTLLREQLDWWPKHHQSIHDRKLIDENKVAWHEAISCSVDAWGMTYLLAVLQRVDPQVADIAARRLIAEFDSGDGLGEWVFQWTLELASRKPLTLQGIPDADPLAQFGVPA